MTFEKSDTVKVLSSNNWLYDSLMIIEEVHTWKGKPIYWCRTNSGCADWYFANELTITDEEYTDE